MSNSIALAAPFDPALLGGPAVAAGPDWRDRVAGWAGAGLSVVVLGFVAHALGTGGLDGLFVHASASPAFWAVFVLAYLASPACEWVIFHRLWRLPRAGMLALLRKEVSNELLFGYSGEAQFYLWARRHVPMTGSPFGAVKDVAVLSALAGNIATLAMMAATAPTLATLAALPTAKAFGGSVAIVIAISLALFLLRRAVFSLPAPALRMVLAVHGVRIALHVGLTALMWHLLLPSVALGSWMLLATLRLMISRLPLVANKDLLFAGMALLLLGPAGGVTAVVATVSGLIVAAHLVVALLVYTVQLAPRMVRGVDAVASLAPWPMTAPSGARWGLRLRLPRARPTTRVRSQARHVWRVAAIDRYLFGQAARRFAAVMAVVIIVMTLENGPRLAADLSHTDTPWALLWMLSVDLVPEHLAIALPIATLFSIALTARSLALRGEWQMFAATGLSPARIMAAPLALASIAAVLLLWNGLDLRPRGERQLDALYADISTGRHGVVLPLHQPVALDAGTTLIADDVVAGAPGMLAGVVVRREAAVITATRARVASDGAGGLTLRLIDGTSVETRADGSARRMVFGVMTLAGHPSGLTLVPGNLRHRLDRLGGAGLWRLAGGGAPAITDAARAALIGRIESALFCLLLPGIAIAVGVPPRRRPGGPALLVGVGLIVLHLQTAAMVEDHWAAQAVSANVLHLAGWIAAVWGLTRWMRYRGEGALDLAIERAAIDFPRWIVRGGPVAAIKRLTDRLRLPPGGGLSAPTLQPARSRPR